MAWTTPSTAVAGSTELTAALWNEQVRDQLRVLGNVKTKVETAVVTMTNVPINGSAEITGFNVTITPTGATSRILIMVMANVGDTQAGFGGLILYRNSTPICIGDAEGSRRSTTAGFTGVAGIVPVSTPIIHVDSPNTTSAVTYKVFIVNHADGSTNTMYLNRSGNNTDSARFARTASTITAMEIPPE